MIVVRYEEARTALASHLTKGNTMNHLLEDRLAYFIAQEHDTSLSVWKRNNFRLCVKAVEAFQEAETSLGITGIKFRSPKTGHTKLEVAGVNISVSLDLSTEMTEKDGTKAIGGAVLLFSKTGGPDSNIDERCKAIAALVHEFIGGSLAAGETCNPKLCMAIDVFGKKVHRASGAKKQLMKSIENSCEEVVTMWPSIKPPAGYNGPPLPMPKA
jgi:hypothetical protein